MNGKTNKQQELETLVKRMNVEHSDYMRRTEAELGQLNREKKAILKALDDECMAHAQTRSELQKANVSAQQSRAVRKYLYDLVAGALDAEGRKKLDAVLADIAAAASH